MGRVVPTGAAVAQGTPVPARGEREAPPAEVPALARFDAPFQPNAWQIAAAREADEKQAIRDAWEATEDERERVRVAAEAPPIGESMVFTSDVDAANAQLPGVEVRLRSDRATVSGGVAPRPASPEVAAALGSPGRSLVGLSLDESDEAQARVTPPSSSEPRPVPLERHARLDAGELARIDALAAARGISREAMIAVLAEVGIEAEGRRATGPPTPPDAPANDAPPPSGTRRA